MDIYKSANSEYRIENGDLIKIHILEEKNLGKNFVYISTQNFVFIAKIHKIKFNKAKVLEDKVGNKFLAALKKKEMNLDEVGGRYVVLQKGLKDYILFYSGIITEKTNSKLEIKQSELKLAEDRGLNRLE